MIGKTYPVAITRSGFPIAGSPFNGKLYFVTTSSAKRSENLPEIGHAVRTLQFSASNPRADIRTGDLVDLSATPFASFSTIGKVVEARPYSNSLQCPLQRAPYMWLKLRAPSSMTDSTDIDTRNVSDAMYVSAGNILGYIEPMTAENKAYIFGLEDIRASRLFSLSPIAQNQVVIDGDGEYWVASTASEHYPGIDDYITSMRHLLFKPPGLV